MHGKLEIDKVGINIWNDRILMKVNLRKELKELIFPSTCNHNHNKLEWWLWFWKYHWLSYVVASTYLSHKHKLFEKII